MTTNNNNNNNNLKYFIYDEVVIHNTPDDFWIVIHRNVIDLTRMIQDRITSWNDNLEYLTTFGGKDLSNYFEKTGEPKTIISSLSGKKRVLFGPAIESASSDSNKTPGHCWSTDPLYHVGKLTKQERRVRIINTLTGHIVCMKVCEEDTIFQIQKKYKKFYNSHSDSYTWRKNYDSGAISGHLHLNRTLTENGLYHDHFEPPPAIWLYYNDDLTIV